MKITTKSRIGGVEYIFEVEDKSDMETLHQAIVLSNPRRRCNECNVSDLEKKVMTSRKDKEGNTYVNMLCISCGAESKLGQYKAGGYFWREYEKWQKQEDVSADDIPDEL